MIRKRATWAWRTAVLSVMTGLGACGGGGGGSSTAPAPTGSGLVPTAGTLGAVLKTDATVLRPLVANGVWTYRGTDTPTPGTQSTIYTDVVTQTASSPGFSEVATNSANDGTDTSVISAANGTVSATTSIALTAADQGSSLTYAELRSPVRQNDQVTVLDQHLADSGGDADGDGKNDAADIAIYRVVIGPEDVAFDGNLPTQHAVRVDTIGLVRFTLSSTGKTTPTVQAVTVSTWYAPGIGIVRQRSTTPNVDGTNHVVDETLVSWDGVTQGFGALAAQPVVQPASGPAPGAALEGSYGTFSTAFVVGDHALLFAQTSDPITAQQVAQVSRMDQRGTVTDTYTYPVVSVFESFLVGYGGGALSLEPVDSGGSTLWLTRWDADGHLVGTARGAQIVLSQRGGIGDQVRSSAKVVDGSTLWVAWTRLSSTVTTSGYLDQLVVRSFDLAGQPLSDEIVVETVPDATFPTLAVKNGRALVAWTVSNLDGTFDTREAVIDGSALTVPPTSIGNVKALLQPVLLDQGGAVLLYSFGSSTWAGVRLDAAFAPLRTTGGSLLTESLNGTPSLSGTVRTRLLPAAVGNRITFAGNASGPLYAGGSDQNIDEVSWIDAGAGPLATTPVRTVRTDADPSGALVQLAWPDRIILLEGFYQLTSKVVWLNTGTAN